MKERMDYEVRWKNFKGFKDTGWITIKPLTILIGPNNSGKTSFTAPLLLLSQTVTSRDSSSALIVKGCTYDGGNIKELLTNYELKNDLFLGFRYQKNEPPKSLKKIGEYPPGAIELTFSINNELDREIILKKEVIKDIFDRELLCFSKTKKGKLSISGIDTNNMIGFERHAIENCNPVNFLLTTDEIFSSLVKEQTKAKYKNYKKFSNAFGDALRAISFNTSQVTNILGNLSYIGPIRENPHRVYEISNESYNTVGHKGENTPNLLKKYIGSFNDELNEWIRKFEFGDSIEFKQLVGNLYSIRFRDKDKERYTSIANAGFGASQLLPLIVQALVASEESITMAEQPEIHLNPKLQCVLADLFANMANNRRRVIVETHSEHLLLRLRYLIANKTISSNDVAVYFIEKIKGSSRIKEVKIEEDGHIEESEWPTDFFGDTLRESIALANEQIKHGGE